MRHAEFLGASRYLRSKRAEFSSDEYAFGNEHVYNHYVLYILSKGTKLNAVALINVIFLCDTFEAILLRMLFLALLVFI